MWAKFTVLLLLLCDNNDDNHHYHHDHHHHYYFLNSCNLFRIQLQGWSLAQVNVNTLRPYYKNYTDCSQMPWQVQDGYTDGVCTSIPGWWLQGGQWWHSLTLFGCCFTRVIPRTKTRLGKRSFTATGPRVWNSAGFTVSCRWLCQCQCQKHL